MKMCGKGLVAASLLAAAACGRGNDAQAQDNRAVQQQLGNVPAVLDTSLAGKLSATFRAAAARALPAVVYIRVASRPQVARAHPNVPGLPPGFFGPPDDNSDEPEVATGSGFIYDASGLIMTNNHVVADAQQVYVRLVDGREYYATVVGRDPNTDVAVIRITPRSGDGPLPVVQLGNSDQAQVGDWVVALGNPLGLNFTVTAGIVSAKGRSIGILAERQGQQALESYIQTDAAINPGNSGGPLVDLTGKVLAINSAIESPTGTFVGFGFAIPINLASRVATDLVRYGAVHRPRLGISVKDASSADLELNGLSNNGGAFVASVQPGTPAAAAGVQPGDVVVAINNQPIHSGTELTTTLAEHQPGDEITMTVYRNRQRLNLQAHLGQFEAARAATGPAPARAGSEERLGVTVAPLTPELQRQYRVQRSSGIVITGVSPLSPAAGVVFRGEIILSINGQPVNSAGDVERIAATLRPGQIVSMRLFDSTPDVGETVANFRVR